MEYSSPLDPPAPDDSHPLLEPRAPAYTNATVRRAFIVWLRCGQRNRFRDVCNYYHCLEAMEDQLPADMRAASRHLEFSLFVEQPPTSPYLQQMFPHLYSSPHLESQGYPQAYLQNYHTVVEENNQVKIEEIEDVHKAAAMINFISNIKAEKERKDKFISHKDIFEAGQAFRSDCQGVETITKINNRIGLAFANYDAENIKKVNELTESKIKPKVESDKESVGTSKKDILETSQIIKKYCKDQQVPLRNFLESFKEYAARCELNNTVNNLGYYIKRKMIHAELGLAVKVHRAKIYNDNKENLIKNSVLSKDLTPKCETLNVDNAALISGFKKLTFALKTKANIQPVAKDTCIKNNKIDKVSFEDKEKRMKVLKREETNTTGFLTVHSKVDILKYRKI